MQWTVNCMSFHLPEDLRAMMRIMPPETRVGKAGLDHSNKIHCPRQANGGREGRLEYVILHAGFCSVAQS